MTSIAIMNKITTNTTSGESRKWLEPLQHWPSNVVSILRKQTNVARVVVASVRGSAPREAGTCMLVTNCSILGTIGGGQLEWTSIELARSLLASSSGTDAQLHKLVLGAELAQCCGGVVEIWIERYTIADLNTLESISLAMSSKDSVLISTISRRNVKRQVVLSDAHKSITSTMSTISGPTGTRLVRNKDGITSLIEMLCEVVPSIWLYGAGHVGQALVHVLGQLPVQVTWIDNRAELLPTNVLSSIRVVHAVDPVSTVALAPGNDTFIVMTHSHALDYSICQAVLTRNQFDWVGVIGSRSKGARFRSRLAKDGVSPEMLARLICPIGIDAINSKLPGAIAISVAAQLVQVLGLGEARDDKFSAAFTENACSGNSCDACARGSNKRLNIGRL